jgi:hypothetical protein
MLGDGGEDMDGQAVRLRHVDRDELRPALHQVRDESDVACQPIELSNAEDRFVLPTSRERGRELRAIVSLAALDLDEGGD